MAIQKSEDALEFWQEFETKYGEKVLSFTLGQYLSGWDGHESPLWGLLIATDGGFRFHHFPHEGWIQVLSRLSSGGKAPTEKTLFVPRDRIILAELRTEKSLLRRIFTSSQPKFILRYRDEAGAEEEFIAETDTKAAAIVNQYQDGSVSLGSPENSPQN
jgi:hypothetical protein